MKRVSSLVSMVGGVVLAVANPSAWAYPTSVVFAPSGESKRAGELGAFLYGSLSLAPAVSAGSSWYGFNVGLLPKFAYGVGDLTFGGLEVGVDALSTDLAGTPSAFVKTVFNAKAQLIMEQGVAPSFAVGVLGLHPFRTERSINMVYGTTTKTLGEYGHFTLGAGASLNESKADPYRESFPVFYGTAPFSKASNLLLLGGYESPSWGPVSFAVDHLGGVSELSSTNLVMNLSPVEGGTLGLGGYFGSDPQAFSGGLFAYLFLNFNVLKVFAKDVPSAHPCPATPPESNQEGETTERPRLRGAPQEELREHPREEGTP